MIFVYVIGSFGKPVPEKWPEVLHDMNGKPLPCLASHALTPGLAKLSIDELVKIYPPPPELGEVG